MVYIYCNECGYMGNSKEGNCPKCRSAVTVKVRHY